MTTKTHFKTAGGAKRSVAIRAGAKGHAVSNWEDNLYGWTIECRWVGCHSSGWVKETRDDKWEANLGGLSFPCKQTGTVIK